MSTRKACRSSWRWLESCTQGSRSSGWLLSPVHVMDGGRHTHLIPRLRNEPTGKAAQPLTPMLLADVRKANQNIQICFPVWLLPGTQFPHLDNPN